MNDRERTRSLDHALGEIEKAHGKGAILRLGSRDSIVPVSVIPTGSIAVDAALGVGGLPRGRLIEIYGPERLMVNSAGDWGPSKPTAVPDFILAMRRRGHPESLIRKVVYENPLQFFSQSRNFQFTPPEVPQTAEL